MEKEDIILWLIAHYEYCKAEIKKLENIDDILNFCMHENVHCGICRASTYEFGEFIYANRWVSKYNTTKDKYWCKIPHVCTTKDKILNTFKIRLHILYKELYL